MIFFLYMIHVLTCIFLILVVLLQQGKGADLSVFGGGSTQTAFGARGAATLLHKLTVGFFVAFLVTTVSIAIAQSGSGSDSVLSGVETEAPASETAAEVPADQPAAEVTTDETATATEATDAAPAEEAPAEAPATDEGTDQ